MFQLKMKVEGYCTNPLKRRLETIDLESRTLTEEVKVDTEVKIKKDLFTKTETKKKKNKKVKLTEVYELPDKYDNESKRYVGLKYTYEYLKNQFPFQLQGVIRAIVSNFDAKKAPPLGRYGFTGPLGMWSITIKDIHIDFVHFNKWAKKITVKGANRGSFNTYADQVDFTATIDVDNPILWREEVKELVKKVISYLQSMKIGTFQHGRITLEEVKGLE